MRRCWAHSFAHADDFSYSLHRQGSKSRLHRRLRNKFNHEASRESPGEDNTPSSHNKAHERNCWPTRYRERAAECISTTWNSQPHCTHCTTGKLTSLSCRQPGMYEVHCSTITCRTWGLRAPRDKDSLKSTSSPWIVPCARTLDTCRCRARESPPSVQFTPSSATRTLTGAAAGARRAQIQHTNRQKNKHWRQTKPRGREQHLKEQ